MRAITPELSPELLAHVGDPKYVASVPAYSVETYRDLVKHIANLSFLNKDHLLFYRGQRGDFLNKAGMSSFYPSIYRSKYLTKTELQQRFATLREASRQLKQFFSELETQYQELERRYQIQWSILQHYEVCATPLLDFTHSLRVACSFAMLYNDTPDAYVFVFGFPYFTNRISFNSEHDLVNVRLLSICPPIAVRPHFQEGYLIGTDNIEADYKEKIELDFNRRLVAKFKISNTKDFWGKEFNKIPEELLYPDKTDKNDSIATICSDIKESLPK